MHAKLASDRQPRAAMKYDYRAQGAGVDLGNYLTDLTCQCRYGERPARKTVVLSEFAKPGRGCVHHDRLCRSSSNLVAWKHIAPGSVQ